MRRHKEYVLLLTVAIMLLMPTVALGHAVLDMAIPGRDSTVTASPLREVRLHYTEAVEVRFSTFKVYPLHSADENIPLAAVASQLVSNVLTQRGDEAARADAGIVTNARTSEEIIIRMKEDLAPGPYVVMWRVLSIDTHTTQGFYVFHYEPEA